INVWTCNSCRYKCTCSNGSYGSCRKLIKSSISCFSSSSYCCRCNQTKSATNCKKNSNSDDSWCNLYVYIIDVSFLIIYKILKNTRSGYFLLFVLNGINRQYYYCIK